MDLLLKYFNLLNIVRIIRFELITLRLKGEYSANWVTFPEKRINNLYFII